MQGLELSEKYYNEICAPMISEKFPKYENRIASGLVGMGSECFGFDDEISRDHDWGISICLWLKSRYYHLIGFDLQKELDKLPNEFDGVGVKNKSAWGDNRSGVFEIGSFYKRFIGLNRAPLNLKEWRVIPEVNLAVATNGKVFKDIDGEFTNIRNKLKGFYPEDIRIKKIAARCMKIAQSGQYNFLRSIKRKEFVSAFIALSEFIEAAISIVFLLNKKYRPFYKWMHRALLDLDILGKTLHPLFLEIVSIQNKMNQDVFYRKKSRIIEEVCANIITELKRQKLSNSSSDFLADHGIQVQNKIENEEIRKIDVWSD